MRDYKTARTIYGLLEFIAWVAVAGGLIFAVAGASATTGFARSPIGALGAVPGLVLALIGILAVAAVQDFRAGVDTAEMTGKMLALQKEQLQLVKDAQSFGFEANNGAGASSPTTHAKSASPPKDVRPESKTVPAPAEQIGSEGEQGKIESTYSRQIEHAGETVQLESGKAESGRKTFDRVDVAKEYVPAAKSNGRAEPTISLPGPDQRSKPQKVPQGLA